VSPGLAELPLVRTAGSHGDLDAADRGGNLSADLEQFESDGTDGGPGQAGRLQRSAAQAFHQHIGERGHQEAELIGAEGVGGGAISKQVELLFLDAVFHLSASTVDLLIEGLSGIVASRQGGDDEAGVGAAGQDLGFGHHAALAGPALLGAIGEVGEEADRLLLLVEEGLGLSHLGGDGVLQAGVTGQAEQIVDLMLLTPPHQLFPGKAGVGPQQDLDLRPDTPQAGDDALDVVEGIGGGIDVGGPEPALFRCRRRNRESSVWV